MMLPVWARALVWLSLLSCVCVVVLAAAIGMSRDEWIGISFSLVISCLSIWSIPSTPDKTTEG